MITPRSVRVPGFISLREMTQVAAAIQRITLPARRAFRRRELLHYNSRMAARRKFFLVAGWIASGLAPALVAQQTPLAPPEPTAARILLLPRRIVSGERATLAVLDV